MMRRYIGLLGLVAALMSAANAQFVLEPINIGPIDPSSWGSDFDPASGFRFRLNVSNVPSWDGLNDPDNVRATLNIGAPGIILNGVYWNVTLEAISPSWLSELALLFVDVNGNGFILRPGAGQNRGGTGTFSGGTKLRDAGLADLPLPDGNLYLQFYETFDDFPNAIDGYWRSGFVEFQWVPEPASVLILSAGLAGLALRRRKK